MDTRSELVGGKRGGEEGGGECDYLGLGLRDMQENQSSGHKRAMVVPHNHHHHHHHHHLESQSLLSCFRESTTGGSGGGGGGGPMFCNTSNEVACVGDIYDVVVAAAGSDGNSSVMVPKSINSSESLFPFNYSAPGNVNMRLPFTAAQLQELERQNLIYKYIMASAPIPHQLLLPITKTPSNAPPSHSNTNPEPWRCRRTDGKKWRCSRDVAPDQKYCERHSHKSRPRSRKPVELPPHTISNNNNSNSNSNPSLTHSLNLASNTNYNPYPKSSSFNQTMVPTAALCEQQSRCLDWLIKGDMSPATSNSNQQWHQMMQSKFESSKDSTRCSGYCGEHLIDSNSKVNLAGSGGLALQAQRLQDHYSSLLGTNLLSHQAETQESNQNTNAWSIPPQSFGAMDERHRLYSLTLAMSGGSETIERNDNVMMGTEKGNVVNLRPHWMNHVSHSQPGGPLAEALCLGSARSDSNAGESPHGCSTSTTASGKSSREDGGPLQHGFNFIN